MLSSEVESLHYNITVQLCMLAKRTKLSDSSVEIVVAVPHPNPIDIRIVSCTNAEEQDTYVSRYLQLVEEELNHNGYSDKYTLGTGPFPDISDHDKFAYIGSLLKYVIVKWNIERQLPAIVDSFHMMQHLKEVMREQQSKQASNTI